MGGGVQQVGEGSREVRGESQEVGVGGGRSQEVGGGARRCVWGGGDLRRRGRGGGGSQEVGKGGAGLKVTLQCHHQNVCIKTGSDPSCFNDSLIVRGRGIRLSMNDYF